MPDGTRFLACAFCGSRLEVQHTGSAVITRVLEELTQRTEDLDERVEALTSPVALLRAERDLAEAVREEAEFHRRELSFVVWLLLLWFGGFFVLGSAPVLLVVEPERHGIWPAVLVLGLFATAGGIADLVRYRRRRRELAPQLDAFAARIRALREEIARLRAGGPPPA